MNNDNGLNFHSVTKLSGWLRYYVHVNNMLDGAGSNLTLFKYLSWQSVGHALQRS